VEHHAVLHPVRHLGGRTVGGDGYGRVDLAALADALDESVSLVSVMAVNNEVGTITPMAEVAEVVRARAPGAVLHTDAIQAHSWVDTAALAQHVDAMSLSGHKVGGPKGIGALILRNGLAVEPLVFGGGQERDRRSGTHDVAGIVAFAEAVRLCALERAHTVERIGALRDHLVDGLLATVPGLGETVPRNFKVASNAHLCLSGVESEALLFLLDRAGVYASAGSSCSSGAVSGSHVLGAMGVAPSVAAGAVRFTLGWSSTAAEVEHVLSVMPAAVAQLRRPVSGGVNSPNGEFGWGKTVSR
jgi:cysteine desulfurase